jgi:hypothetical protein
MGLIGLSELPRRETEPLSVAGVSRNSLLMFFNTEPRGGIDPQEAALDLQPLMKGYSGDRDCCSSYSYNRQNGYGATSDSRWKRYGLVGVIAVASLCVILALGIIIGTHLSHATENDTPKPPSQIPTDSKFGDLEATPRLNPNRHSHTPTDSTSLPASSSTDENSVDTTDKARSQQPPSEVLPQEPHQNSPL